MKSFLVFIGLIASIAFGVSVYFLGSDKIFLGPIALSSIFNGMLALAGFMLTARTFIVFKLNETIYGTDSYREFIGRLKTQGLHDSPLYAPLKSLDANLAKTCILCLVTLMCIAFFGIFPKEWGSGNSLASRLANEASFFDFVIQHKCYLLYQLALVVVYVFIFSSIIRVLYSIVRVNENIKDIIKQWESNCRV